jgi:hypothetical protein
MRPSVDEQLLTVAVSLRRVGPPQRRLGRAFSLQPRIQHDIRRTRMAFKGFRPRPYLGV